MRQERDQTPALLWRATLRGVPGAPIAAVVGDATGQRVILVQPGRPARMCALDGTAAAVIIPVAASCQALAPDGQRLAVLGAGGDAAGRVWQWDVVAAR